MCFSDSINWNVCIFISFLYSEKKVIDLEKPLLTGAFVDPAKVAQHTEKDYILPEIPPFSWLINPKVQISLHTNESI